MELFDLIHSGEFWFILFLSFIVLAALRIAADQEAVRPYCDDRVMRRNCVRPPGILGISFGETRLLKMDTRRPRCLHPLAHGERIAAEPTLVARHVGAWFILFGAWPQAAAWWGCALFWRLAWDGSRNPTQPGAQDIPTKLTLVHCAWAASSRLYYAALTALFLIVVLGLILLLGAAASRPSRRRR